MVNRYENLKKGERGAWVSILAYLILATVKLIVATIGGSTALRADGLNNTTDVIAAVAVLIGLRISRKPPDSDHHYGHFRAELIASLIASFIMITVGIQVIIGTFNTVIEANYQQPSWFTAWVALGSSVIMIGVHFFNLKLSRKISSTSLYAASQDNRSDALISFAAFIGIVGAQFGLYWLDPVAGFFVGVIICKTAWDIFKNASHTLTDGFDEDKIEEVRASIIDDSEVIEVKDVKGRIHGNQSLLDITIYVDPNISVAKGHLITDRIESLLAEQHDVPHAQIHVEPNPSEEFPKKNNDL